MAVDFYRIHVWLVFGLALVVLTPIRNAEARKWLLAAINLLFVAFLVRKQLPLLIVGLVGAYIVLRLIQSDKRRGLIAGAAGLCILFLWVVHKLPALGPRFHMAALNPIMISVGFSFVFLRMIDAMRAVIEEGKPAPDLPQTINYLIPLNMLAAGPIQAYNEFLEAPGLPMPLTFEQAMAGAERIIQGIFKKYVLAYIVQRIFLTDFRSHGFYLFLEAQLYYIWLYLDFSACSDIAVGMGTLMGVSTPENFDRPFLARNVIDFWQRWHISLSQFVRRNIFVPVQLALMRRTGGKNQLFVASIAFLFSFLLVGLWHNVNIPWLFWGLIQALGLITCNLYRHALIKRFGRKWVNRSLANPWLRFLSIAATYEFWALSLAAVMRLH